MDVDVIRRLAVALVLLWAPSAGANPWDVYGFNPRAQAMGSAHTALADDFTAVYYNPAALTAAKDDSFGLAFTYAKPRLRMNFDKSERSQTELLPPSATGVTLGALFTLGGQSFKNRLAAGIGLNIPTNSLFDGQAIDPAVPYWYMYQSLPRRIVASIGAAAAPFDWISLGASVQILAGVTGRLDYELDVVRGRFSRTTVIFDVSPKLAPIAGLELRPLEGLRIGATYRGSISADIGLPVDIEVTGIADLEVQTFFQVQYTPHQLSFGASYDLKEWGTRISADLTWAMWSKAPDPSVDSSIDVGGQLFDETGLSEVFDAPAPGQERGGPLEFRDIFIPRFGVEQRLWIFSLRAGYGIRPSPAPLQAGETNYVDATTHEISFGAGVRLKDPWGLLANPLMLDLSAGFYVVPSRRYDKIDPQDPVGGYNAQGSIFVLGVGFRYAFGEAPVSSAAPKPAPKAAPKAAPKTAPTEDELPEGDADL